MTTKTYFYEKQWNKTTYKFFDYFVMFETDVPGEVNLWANESKRLITAVELGQAPGVATARFVPRLRHDQSSKVSQWVIMLQDTLHPLEDLYDWLCNLYSQ